jgi:hypothetical protein
LEKTSYLGLPNCYRLSNAATEVVVTTDVGPRIVRYALAGGDNILGEHPDAAVQTPWGEWKPWAGHRLWAAPEANPRSYAPDNDPVRLEAGDERTVTLRQEADSRTGLEKELVVRLDAEGAGVRLTHRIRNRNLWAVELAPWALTIMRPRGEVLIPQEPYGPHPDFLLPARPLVLWHYTDLSDPRLTLGRKFIRLKVSAEAESPQKIGLLNKQGWVAYHADETLFVKRYGYAEGATYPDYNCNTEVFTAGPFVEIESLAPLARLEPGEQAEHEEHWNLYRGVTLGTDEEEIEDALASFVGRED